MIILVNHGGNNIRSIEGSEAMGMNCGLFVRHQFIRNISKDEG